MLNQIRARWHRHRQLRAFEKLQAWYALTNQIWQICGEALRNEKVGQMGAGGILDQVDRMIFRLNDQPPPVDSFLRRQDPELAKVIHSATENIFHLRNHTALFLIHCQGPMPAEFTPDDAESVYFYQRAMDRHGLKALEVWKKLEVEFAAIREGMRRLEMS